MKKSTFISIVIISALAIAGCREPVEDTIPFYDFDPGSDSNTDPGQLCPEGTTDLFNNSLSPYLGGEESVELELVVFAYFNCGHCATLAKITNELWEEREDLRKYVRVYFHHYPFSNTAAFELHGASLATYNQSMDHFWTLHDHLFENLAASTPLKIDDVISYVDSTLGLDMDKFHAERESEKTLGFLQWDKSQAEALEVTGTPALFICGARVENEYLRKKEDLGAVIDGYLYP